MGDLPGALFALVEVCVFLRLCLSASLDLKSLQYLIIANLSGTIREYLMTGEGQPVELLSRRLRFLLRAAEATT